MTAKTTTEFTAEQYRAAAEVVSYTGNPDLGKILAQRAEDVERKAKQRDTDVELARTFRNAQVNHLTNAKGDSMRYFHPSFDGLDSAIREGFVAGVKSVRRRMEQDAAAEAEKNGNLILNSTERHILTGLFRAVQNDRRYGVSTRSVVAKYLRAFDK